MYVHALLTLSVSTSDIISLMSLSLFIPNSLRACSSSSTVIYLAKKKNQCKRKLKTEPEIVLREKNDDRIYNYPLLSLSKYWNAV